MLVLWITLVCSLVSQVDPIVASFSGGAVGVISALMLIEANNVEQHEKKRCKYCHGKGVSQFVPSMKFQLITDYLLNMKSFL